METQNVNITDLLTIIYFDLWPPKQNPLVLWNVCESQSLKIMFLEKFFFVKPHTWLGIWFFLSYLRTFLDIKKSRMKERWSAALSKLHGHSRESWETSHSLQSGLAWVAWDSRLLCLCVFPSSFFPFLSRCPSLLFPWFIA